VKRLAEDVSEVITATTAVTKWAEDRMGLSVLEGGCGQVAVGLG